MRPSDAARVGAWNRELWDGDEGDNENETIFVWEADAETIGALVSVSLRPRAEGCTGQPVPYVEGWYVADRCSRHGVGLALM
jgi:hypothetical protein